MNKLITVGLVSLCLFLVGCSSRSDTIVPEGSRAPATRFTMIDGSMVSTEQLAGKPAVVMFWATSCSHSRPVIEDLNDLARQMKQRGRRVEFLAVSIDKHKNYEKLQERIKYSKLDALRHSFSGNDIYDEAYILFGADELPTIFILDQHGQIAAVGSDTDMVEEYFGYTRGE